MAQPKTTLLQRAQTRKTQRHLGVYPTEEIEVAVAYIRGELTGGQAASVMPAIEHPSNAPSHLLAIVRGALIAGILKLDWVEK